MPGNAAAPTGVPDVQDLAAQSQEGHESDHQGQV